MPREAAEKMSGGGLTNPDYEVNQQIFDSSAAGADTATEAVSIYHALKTGQSADNSYIGYEQHGLYNNHALDFHETDVNKQMIPMSQTTIVPNDDMEEEKDSPDDDAGKEETPPGDGTGEDTTPPDAPVDDPSDSDMSDEEENPSETDQDNTAADDEDESDMQDDPADDTEAPETSIKPEKAVKGDDCG